MHARARLIMINTLRSAKTSKRIDAVVIRIRKRYLGDSLPSWAVAMSSAPIPGILPLGILGCATQIPAFHNSLTTLAQAASPAKLDQRREPSTVSSLIPVLI